MKKVYCTRDDSGHWYVIPDELKDRFSKFMNDISNLDDDTVEYYDTVNKFEEEFGKYRTGGDLNNIQLYAKI